MFLPALGLRRVPHQPVSRPPREFSVTAIAALSFTQNLVMSAQRALPMLLLMPAVEPLIVKNNVLGEQDARFSIAWHSR